MSAALTDKWKVPSGQRQRKTPFLQISVAFYGFCCSFCSQKQRIFKNYMISDAFFAEKATEYNLFSLFRCFFKVLHTFLGLKATEIY